ncbi:RNA-binding S4 domain-containing protein [Methylomusa anaerophila]|nr:RNA-binding S4 domain-containing protein [Methylomusa anaerophila]
MNNMEEITIHTQEINLDQLLKWAGIVETGGQAKSLVADGLITINGALITERRKRVRPGDILAIKGIGRYKIVQE